MHFFINDKWPTKADMRPTFVSSAKIAKCAAQNRFYA